MACFIGLLQSIKIGTNKGSIPKSDEGSEFLGGDIIYSYTDFGSVDHRIKLHLILNVFEQENEELAMFLRVRISFLIVIYEQRLN